MRSWAQLQRWAQPGGLIVIVDDPTDRNRGGPRYHHPDCNHVAEPHFETKHDNGWKNGATTGRRVSARRETARPPPAATAAAPRRRADYARARDRLRAAVPVRGDRGARGALRLHRRRRLPGRRRRRARSWSLHPRGVPDRVRVEDVAEPAEVGRNDAATIEEATRRALASADERERMEALIALEGVGVPTASTLLHSAFPRLPHPRRARTGVARAARPERVPGRVLARLPSGLPRTGDGLRGEHAHARQGALAALEGRRHGRPGKRIGRVDRPYPAGADRRPRRPHGHGALPSRREWGYSRGLPGEALGIPGPAWRGRSPSRGYRAGLQSLDRVLERIEGFGSGRGPAERLRFAHGGSLLRAVRGSHHAEARTAAGVVVPLDLGRPFERGVWRRSRGEGAAPG